MKEGLKVCKRCKRTERNLEAKRCVFCGGRRWRMIEKVVKK